MHFFHTLHYNVNLPAFKIITPLFTFSFGVDVLHDIIHLHKIGLNLVALQSLC